MSSPGGGGGGHRRGGEVLVADGVVMEDLLMVPPAAAAAAVPALRPPSQVTLEESSTSEEGTKATTSAHDHHTILPSQQHPLQSTSVRTTGTTATTLPSPSISQASSEEESVAGMGYMSEGSNLSVKDCPPVAVAGEEGGGEEGQEALLQDDKGDNLLLDHNNTADRTFMPAPRRLLPFVPKRAAITTTTTQPASLYSASLSSSLLPSPRTPNDHLASPPAVAFSTADALITPAPQQLALAQHHHQHATLSDNTAAGGGSLSHSLAPLSRVGSTGAGSASGGEILTEEHRPLVLPQFRTPDANMWTASHAANLPTEDRSASLVNLLLQPLPPNFDSETQLCIEADYKTLLRVNLWSVIDGHGGGAVATYASEVLLPHIAASVARALQCVIVDRGVCTVNGQLRDANAMDLDGLIQTSDDWNDKKDGSGNSSSGGGNPNSIHYRSPYEPRSADSEGDEEPDAQAAPTVVERKQLASLKRRVAGATSEGEEELPTSSSSVVDDPSMLYRTPKGAGGSGNSSSRGDDDDHPLRRRPQTPTGPESVSSVKTSVKTAASPAIREALPGTHSPQEVAAISRAITESFLAVDEGWINSIDKVATAQTSCQSNGRWNSGACALVVFTIQRLDWTSVSDEPGDREKEFLGPGGHSRRKNTSQNRDAARRRMLDYAARTKSASSMSTASSTSSLTTEEAVHASGLESEITETEGEDDDDDRSRNGIERNRKRLPPRVKAASDGPYKQDPSLIIPPGSCSCHCYRAHDAMLYTAHVGDCRAVLLGSAPPRTIKVRDPFHPDTTDDESSHHSSDETECLSSSDHDADSSEEEDVEGHNDDGKPSAANSPNSPAGAGAPTTAAYLNFPRRVVRQRSSRRRAMDNFHGPYNPLPPLLPKDEAEPTSPQRFKSVDVDTDIATRRTSVGYKEASDGSSTSSQDSEDPPALIHLPPFTRPIDLTTDHSAYNPAEVTAVLRRCNNAPRAISAGVGGGIKRVAGSLAVTRALGDAYLKTPELSFLPYKRHAPYITARPEVNCRPLVKDVDKVLILATDGVWERASGEDVLRWVRNFYEERIAEAERRNNRRNQVVETTKVAAIAAPQSKEEIETAAKNSQDGAERDLFEQRAPNELEGSNNNRKRDLSGSPIPPAKRRKRSRLLNRVTYNVADVIVRRVLNKVRRSRNISSLQALMSLPQGRARRSKHDDITSSVVDLSAFVA